MGCSSTKTSVQLPPINSNFALTTRNDLDDFFKRASKLLNMMETLRQRIIVTKEKCATLAGTKSLHGSLAYTKAVEVLFWSISASNQGYIYRSNIEVSEKSPFFTLNTIGFCKETIELIQTVKEYLFILSESNDTLQTAVWQLQQLKEEQIEKKKDIDPKFNSKTKKLIDTNMKKLTDGVTTSAKVLSQIPEEQKDARELLRYMQGLLLSCDELGVKCYEHNVIKPKDVFRFAESQRRAEEKRSRSANKGAKGSASPSPTKSLQPALKSNSISGSLDKRDGSSSPKKVEFSDVNTNNTNMGNGNNNLRASQTMTGNIIMQDEERNLHNASAKFEHQGSIHGHNNFMDDPNEVGIHTFGGVKASQGHGMDGSTAKSYQQSPEGKKYIFVGEKSLEVALRENQVDEQAKIKSAGGYLSPGGRKQAGILQIDENVIDDDDDHGFANDSETLKRFIEKAQSYMVTKDN